MAKKRIPNFSQYPTVAEYGLKANDELVKCNRCKNIHKYSERLCKPSSKNTYSADVVCPRCECKVTISTNHNS